MVESTELDQLVGAMRNLFVSMATTLYPCFLLYIRILNSVNENTMNGIFKIQLFKLRSLCIRLRASL